MDGKRDPEHSDDTEQDPALNAIGPAGQNADPSVGIPVSGLPAGGPSDLGKRAGAHDEDVDADPRK